MTNKCLLFITIITIDANVVSYHCMQSHAKHSILIFVIFVLETKSKALKTLGPILHQRDIPSPGALYLKRTEVGWSFGRRCLILTWLLSAASKL